MNNRHLLSLSACVFFGFTSCTPINTVVLNKTGFDIDIEVQFSNNEYSFGHFKLGTSLVLEKKIYEIDMIKYNYQKNNVKIECKIEKNQIINESYDKDRKIYFDLKSC